MKYPHIVTHKTGDRAYLPDTGEQGVVIKRGGYDHEGRQWVRVRLDNGEIHEGNAFKPLSPCEEIFGVRNMKCPRCGGVDGSCGHPEMM